MFIQSLSDRSWFTLIVLILESRKGREWMVGRRHLHRVVRAPRCVVTVRQWQDLVDEDTREAMQKELNRCGSSECLRLFEWHMEGRDGSSTIELEEKYAQDS